MRENSSKDESKGAQIAAETLDTRFQFVVPAILGLICLGCGAISFAWDPLSELGVVETANTLAKTLVPRVADEHAAVFRDGRSEQLAFYLSLANLSCGFAWIVFVWFAYQSARTVNCHVVSSSRLMNFSSFIAWPFIFPVVAYFALVYGGLADGTVGMSRKFIAIYGYVFWPEIVFSALCTCTFRMWVAFFQFLNFMSEEGENG